MTGVDRLRIEKAVRELILAIGENPERPGLRRTPQRVAEAWEEMFYGVGANPEQALGAPFASESSDLVLVRDIRLHSMCEHHLLPFYGRAHVAYLPDGEVVGLSRIADLVELLAARPQIQEDLTSRIADALDTGVHPRGVLVVLECTQACVASRGGRQPDVVTVTTSARGALKSPAARAEVMELLRGGTQEDA